MATGLKGLFAAAFGMMVVYSTGCGWGGGLDANSSQCIGTLLKIGLALHEHHDTLSSCPKAAISDKDGRPGLSWRVAILPYLGQKSLYEKFKLDEPWDSPHNKPLLAEMPEVFAPAPGRRPLYPLLRSSARRSQMRTTSGPKGLRVGDDGVKHYIAATTIRILDLLTAR